MHLCSLSLEYWMHDIGCEFENAWNIPFWFFNDIQKNKKMYMREKGKKPERAIADKIHLL